MGGARAAAGPTAGCRGILSRCAAAGWRGRLLVEVYVRAHSGRCVRQAGGCTSRGHACADSRGTMYRSLTAGTKAPWEVQLFHGPHRHACVVGCGLTCVAAAAPGTLLLGAEVEGALLGAPDRGAPAQAAVSQ
jgi:hypothetical protein